MSTSAQLPSQPFRWNLAKVKFPPQSLRYQVASAVTTSGHPSRLASTTEAPCAQVSGPARLVQDPFPAGSSAQEDGLWTTGISQKAGRNKSGIPLPLKSSIRALFHDPVSPPN